MTEPEQPQTPEPEGEALEVHAEPAAAAAGSPEDSGEETIVEAGDDGLDG